MQDAPDDDPDMLEELEIIVESDYINCDVDLICSSSPRQDDIVAEILDENVDCLNSCAEMEDETFSLITETPSTKDVLTHFDSIRSYCLNNNIDETMPIHKIEDAILKQCIKKMSQKKITDFFS